MSDGETEWSKLLDINVIIYFKLQKCPGMPSLKELSLLMYIIVIGPNCLTYTRWISVSHAHSSADVDVARFPGNFQHWLYYLPYIYCGPVGSIGHPVLRPYTYTRPVACISLVPGSLHFLASFHMMWLKVLVLVIVHIFCGCFLHFV